MRWFVFLLSFFSTYLVSANQLLELVNAPVVFVDEVKINELKTNQFAISMPFANELILNPEQKKMLHEKAIIKIELVYTEYRTSLGFSQKTLNKKRLQELKKIAPNLFEFPLWDFELISQTNGSSREECRPMFHGFIVTCRPNSTKQTLVQEVEYLEKLVKQITKTDSINADKKNLVYDIKTHYDKQKGYIHDTIWKEEEIEEVSPPDFFYNHSLYQDSTVINAFERNKNWDDFVVVTDVTGSMSPYIAQVFVWLRAQTTNKKAKYFVFFNDGDDKASSRKKPLETKGVYTSPNNTLDSVMGIAALCMSRGSGGGESMENDIEALMEVEKYHPQAKEIILIADNLESMRDYKYLEKIKKPVHVILCGAEGRINIQYLDLAKATKGSVHTLKEDVFNLHEVKKGQRITIQEKKYLFEKNRFHFIYD